MAVAVDSFVADVTSNSVTTKTLTTLTVGSGANRALVVCLCLQGSATAPSMTWDSGGTNQAMALITSALVSGSVAKLWLYGLVAPTSGAKTLSASWTGSSDVTLAAGALTGVDQTGGTTTFAHASGVAGTGAMSSTITSATGNWVVGCFTGNGSIASPSATQWWLDNAPNNFSSCGSQVAGAATKTITASGPTPWAFVGVDIVAAGAAASAPFQTNTDLPAVARIGSISLRTWIDPLKLELRGQDRFFGPAGQGPDYDYPNPGRAPIPSIELRTWINSLRLTLLQQDAFPPNGAQDQQFPNPSRAIGSPLARFDPAPLTLSFILPPFGQDDWPLPRSGVAGISLRTWVDPLKLQLQARDTFPPNGAQDQQFPNPPVAAGRGVSLWTWIDPLKTELQGQDALPFGQDDWALPGGGRRNPPLWIDQLALSLSFVIAPFGQDDWPVPRGALVATALKTWTDPLKLQLQGQDQFFGLGGAPQFSWPNPRGATQSAPSWTDQFKLTLNFVIPPFGQDDWPNPRPPGYASALRTWTDPLKLELLNRDTFFGLGGTPQFNWPNPRGAAPLLQVFTDTYQLTLNGVPVPFTQGSWPNPVGPVYATTLRTWLDPFKGVGTDKFFGLAGNPQHDWPNPRRTATVPSTVVDTYKLTLNAISLPFVTTNWPNPAGPTYALALRTWIDPLKLELLNQDKFFGLAGNPQHDWPNPKAPSPQLHNFYKSGTFYTSLPLLRRDPFIVAWG